MGFSELLFRIVITVLLLSVMTKISGSKQIAQMTFYDYIAGIVVGTLAGELSINHAVPIGYGMFSIIFFYLHSILLSYSSRKSIHIRRFLVGKPIILIARGEIQFSALKRAKFDLNILLSQLRMQGYFHIEDVNYAILEPEGTVSIMPKSSARSLKAKDLKLPLEDDSLPANVVIDGTIMRENLKAYQKDEDWLNSCLQAMGYPDIRELALVTLNESGELTVHKKILENENHTVII